MPHPGNLARSAQYRELSVILSMRDAASMWHRARQWDIQAGGRYDARADKIILWSTSASNPVRARRRLGVVSVLWHMPTYDQVTIYRLVWHPQEGGTEEMIWQALAVLLGGTTA